MNRLGQMRKLLALKDLRKVRSQERLSGAVAQETRWTRATEQARCDERQARHLADTYVGDRLALLRPDGGLDVVHAGLIAGAAAARREVAVHDTRAQSHAEKATLAGAERVAAARAHVKADAEVRRFEEVLTRLARAARQRAESRAEDEATGLAAGRAHHGQA